MIKRLPSMIVPALLLTAVLSTSAVKPVEYVRISPSAARTQVRPDAFTRDWHARLHLRSAVGQPVTAQFDRELRCAIGLRGPVLLELLDELRQCAWLLLGAATGDNTLHDP